MHVRFWSNDTSVGIYIVSGKFENECVYFKLIYFQTFHRGEKQLNFEAVRVFFPPKNKREDRASRINITAKYWPIIQSLLTY